MTWHPIASSTDLADRATFHAQLWGREFVAWRADDATLNLWENRCLHRGLRLSRGINDGAELICQYHGWRYANQTAGCTYIPAHPADAPARMICNRMYPVTERYGLVWGSETSDVTNLPMVDVLEAGGGLVLRPIPVNASPDRVAEALETYRFDPSGATEGDRGQHIEVVDRHELCVTLAADDGDTSTHVVLWVQPVDAHRSVIRGVLDTKPPRPARLDVLRYHNARLSRLRDVVEQRAALEPGPDPIDVQIVPVGVELAGLPEAPTAGRTAPLRVQVARKWPVARDIVALELTSIDEPLPTFQPGAHIDVHLPNGLIRQYSLTNGPGELGYYRIGVKLEPESTGGSKLLHESVTKGDVLAISAPRNNFPLRRDSERTVLLAGGIGITPLLSMAQSLQRGGSPHELVVFSRGHDFTPFCDVLDSLGDSVSRHVGLGPEQTASTIRATLGEHTESAKVYVCGPAPMIESTIRIASDLGWPPGSVHSEYFANPIEIDDSSAFQVTLARTATTLDVRPGQTVLEALRDNGIDLPSSCEQGACGTCVANVVEGGVLHQDVYLSADERQKGDRIMTCVSRAASDRLVLDL
jgi:ferredoxin-NADP reductase/nitrite reductase/ring-hydroxylating ferredoxin subunit